MSGGKFDYKEYWIQEIANEVEEALDIHKNKYDGVYDDLAECDEETIKVIEEGAKLLRKAYSFAYNVDRLMEADTGPEDFLKSYNEECADVDNGDYEKGKYWVEGDDD